MAGTSAGAKKGWANRRRSNGKTGISTKTKEKLANNRFKNDMNTTRTFATLMANYKPSRKK